MTSVDNVKSEFAGIVYKGYFKKKNRNAINFRYDCVNRELRIAESILSKYYNYGAGLNFVECCILPIDNKDLHSYSMYKPSPVPLIPSISVVVLEKLLYILTYTHSTNKNNMVSNKVLTSLGGSDTISDCLLPEHIVAYISRDIDGIHGLLSLEFPMLLEEDLKRLITLYNNITLSIFSNFYDNSKYYNIYISGSELCIDTLGSVGDYRIKELEDYLELQNNLKLLEKESRGEL